MTVDFNLDTSFLGSSSMLNNYSWGNSLGGLNFTPQFFSNPNSSGGISGYSWNDPSYSSDYQAYLRRQKQEEEAEVARKKAAIQRQRNDNAVSRRQIANENQNIEKLLKNKTNATKHIQDKQNSGKKFNKASDWGNAIWNGVKNFALGAVCTRDKKTGKFKFSPGKALLTVGVAVGVGLLCATGVGAVLTPLLVYGGMALGAYQVGTSAINYSKAKTYEDKEKAIEGGTEGLLTAVTSAFGIKALNAERAANAGKMAANLGGVLEKDSIVGNALSALKGAGKSGERITGALDALKGLKGKSAEIDDIVSILGKGGPNSIKEAKAALIELKLKDPDAVKVVMEALNSSKGKLGKYREAMKDLEVLTKGEKSLEGAKDMANASKVLGKPFISKFFKAGEGFENPAVEGQISNLKNMVGLGNGTGEKAQEILTAIDKIKNATSREEIRTAIEEAQKLLSGSNFKQTKQLEIFLGRLNRQVDPDLITMISRMHPSNIDIKGTINNVRTGIETIATNVKNGLKIRDGFGPKEIWGNIGAPGATTNAAYDSAVSMSYEGKRQEKQAADFDKAMKKLAELDEKIGGGFQKVYEKMSQKAERNNIPISQVIDLAAVMKDCTDENGAINFFKLKSKLEKADKDLNDKIAETIRQQSLNVA